MLPLFSTWSAPTQLQFCCVLFQAGSKPEGHMGWDLRPPPVMKKPAGETVGGLACNAFRLTLIICMTSS